MMIFQKSGKNRLLYLFVLLIFMNRSFPCLSGWYMLLRTSCLYTHAFKKWLVVYEKIPVVGITWVKNDPFIVNDIKRCIFLQLVCFRYKIIFNNLFMQKTFIINNNQSESNLFSILTKRVRNFVTLQYWITKEKCFFFPSFLFSFS
jgi:hypothetical protein